MDETWNRIEAWLEQHAPGVRELLGKPASESSIAKVEQAMSVRWPEDLRASLRRHNGQLDAGGLVGGWQLYGLDEMLGEWRTYEGDRGQHDLDSFVEPHPAIRSVYWDARWVPVAGLGSSDVVCVDLAPAEGGRVGQVIMRWKDGERGVLAPSFGAWLSTFADDLVAGRYKVGEAGLERRRSR